tara:strand:+ start:17651 stop:17839 length:189 start_codon:yes stop_codon:yes gene_type:complete
MDRFLAAFLCGLITGCTCFCIPLLYDGEGEKDQWGMVGFLLGMIGGFVGLIFGLVYLFGGSE